MADMMAAEGEGGQDALSGRRGPSTAERSGEVSGGEVEEKAGAKHPSQTGVFDVQRGEENCSGYDNQVAREGRGMCLAKQAAGNETSDGQAAAGVSDMGEQQREEVDSEGRPSLGRRAKV